MSIDLKDFGMYSQTLKNVLANAAEAAAKSGLDYLLSDHVVCSICQFPQSKAAQRLQEMDVDLEKLFYTIARTLPSVKDAKKEVPEPGKAKCRVTVELSRMLERTAAEARQRSCTEISTDLFLYSVLVDGATNAAKILKNLKVTPETFSPLCPDGVPKDAASRQTSPAGGGEAEEQDMHDADNGKKKKTPALDAFGRDLTALAEKGELDPIIGRDAEIRRVVQILSRRTKNNAVLIGEAGVGKTAIAEGLAEAIAAGNVPERMQNRRVISLDLGRLVAGTQYRGQFEDRVKAILDETRKVKNVILFIDEIHTLVGAGNASGSLDAAGMLKPALARGEVQCVGATTLKEYNASIEKDDALERRFQKVMVREPSEEDAIEIMRGIVSRYEEHHNVKYTPEAVNAAVRLTMRYLPSRQLPDKAIDAVDEAGARVRIRNSVRPPDLKEEKDRIKQYERQKMAAIEAENFDIAARYRDAERDAKADFDRKMEEWRKNFADKPVEVTEDDVAETVADLSGVPVQRVSKSDLEKLLHIEDSLKGSVVGQEKAVDVIARSLRRSRALLGDPNRPIGSFLFLGPTGVGKSLLAKTLAEKVYGDPKALVTIDMAEFSDNYTVSRLVGSPPGYVGYGEGGQLTEKVRRWPYSVVLFDEFEKAAPQVTNFLLQILEEGRLTDSEGRRIDFRNTIVICTANLGFDFAKEGRSFGFSRTEAENSYDSLRDKLLDEAKRTFRPELLNRFDEVVVFRKLEHKDVLDILGIEVGKVRERLAKRGMDLKLDKKAVEFLAKEGSDPSMGARPLRRALQRHLEDPLSELLLKGTGKKLVRATLAKNGKSLAFR